MEKFVPYEKLSKKKRRELDAARRGSWGGLNPVTRKPQNSKAYKRKKTWKWDRDDPAPRLFCAGERKTASGETRRPESLCLRLTCSRSSRTGGERAGSPPS